MCGGVMKIAQFGVALLIFIFSFGFEEAGAVDYPSSLQQRLNDCKKNSHESFQIELTRWSYRYPGEDLAQYLPNFLHDLALNCPKVSHLILSGNSLTEIPEEISELGELEYLGLHENRLNHVPPVLKEMTQLTRVTLYSNEISAIPFWARRFFIYPDGTTSFNLYLMPFLFRTPKVWKRISYSQVVSSFSLLFQATEAVRDNHARLNVNEETISQDLQDLIFTRSLNRVWTSSLKGVIYAMEKIDRSPFFAAIPLVFGEMTEDGSVFTQEELNHIRRLSRARTELILVTSL
jgi:Leucine-rich repeat (LRR) protein